MIKSLQGVFAHFLKQWLCAIALGFVLPITSWAAPACLAPNGGIGGTGAPTEHGVIGGTGASVTHGGIGGTGTKESPAKGGIGGTGLQAEGGIGGTGIVGIITGFGSVCVNGLELDYDSSTPVSINGLPTSTKNLALGQVVAIDASGTNANLVANSISIINALEGPVTQIQADSGVLYVMGQRVRTTTDTYLVGISSLGETTLGQPVRVSGYRNAADEVVASRIEAVVDLPVDSVIGMITNDRIDKLTVSGLSVRSSVAMWQNGTETLVRGTWDGEHLNATSIQNDPSLPFVGHAEQVVIEGLVLKHVGMQQVVINGFNITLSTETALNGGQIEDAQEGRRIRVTGRLGRGRQVTADHIELMHIDHMGQPMSEMGHGGSSGLGATMLMGTTDGIMPMRSITPTDTTGVMSIPMIPKVPMGTTNGISFPTTPITPTCTTGGMSMPSTPTMPTGGMSMPGMPMGGVGGMHRR